MPGSLGSSDSQPFGTVFSGLGYPMTMITTPPTSNADLSPSPLIDSGLSHLQKHTHLQFCLPSEETVPQAAQDPCKKVKTVYTTIGLCTVVWTWIVDVTACRSQQGSHERLKTSNCYTCYSWPGQAITLSPHKWSIVTFIFKKLKLCALLHTSHLPWYSFSFSFRTTLCHFSPDRLRCAVQARLCRKCCRHVIGLGPYHLSMTSYPSP